ncbi:hypothetical protein [Desulfurobacterium indicum]|uniref:CRISPR type III-B/RAMP module-associated protein Cmr5 n=1 Tax=Desulfurobacterium indicum TaxID=1914305 RepID=A0A1R1MJE5_9BACT|nr:hypothetical protein [Desulfurobacterium indicum]OMH39824.1 hypothetical protein BLW93_08580 [Desulfurobacterium indicum]
MNSQKLDNIEALTSKIAFEIVSKIQESKDKTKLKNLIDKSLGILSNNGIYAYYVFIISQKEEAIQIFLDELEEIFNIAKPNDKEYSHQNREEYFQLLSENLHKLLFIKQLLEKTLIYARYHAKALGD